MATDHSFLNYLFISAEVFDDIEVGLSINGRTCLSMFMYICWDERVDFIYLEVFSYSSVVPVLDWLKKKNILSWHCVIWFVKYSMWKKEREGRGFIWFSSSGSLHFSQIWACLKNNHCNSCHGHLGQWNIWIQAHFIKPIKAALICCLSEWGRSVWAYETKCLQYHWSFDLKS